ncbi:MAG: hypothetical protein HC817_01545 [Saprospiraceae bacterium]|nr:hypothetical protein [Saprospiraceae bacterium]
MKSIKNFFTVTLFAVGTPLLAQEAQFSVRFASPQFDCATGKARVQVQVKAQNANKIFRMGDANYRFTYNPTQMRSPRIASEDGFSNKALKKDLNYLSQTLQGSRELPTVGIVSLNTFYTGSGRSAAVVNTDWQPVSTLEFDVLDWNKPISLKWQNGKTFPVTGMSSVKLAALSNEPDGFEYNLENTEGVGFQDLIVRPRDFCKASAPTVESGKMRMRPNESAKICLPILDSDADDTHTANLMVNSDKGKVTIAVQDGSMCLNFAPNKDWTGREVLLVNVLAIKMVYALRRKLTYL